MTATLFDSHCHLDDPRFRDDFDEVLERARAAGVRRITTIGCANNLESVGTALTLARQHSAWVSATVGVHPHDAKELGADILDSIKTTARDPLIVAIGETGLDYHYDHSPRPAQQEAFRQQIAVARDLKKPLVIHTRNAPADTLRILAEEEARDVGGIIHCFSEDAAFAQRAWDLGFVASFSGIVTFKGAAAVQDAARRQPLEALLVETDAPYLAPIPHRGQRNEPAYVGATARFIAQLRDLDEVEFIQATYENACRIFGLESH